MKCQECQKEMAIVKDVIIHTPDGEFIMRANVFRCPSCHYWREEFGRVSSEKLELSPR